MRLASQKYDASKSYDDPYVHLTNYSLNRNCKDFDSAKHKLRLRDVLKGELVPAIPNVNQRKIVGAQAFEHRFPGQS